ncbi:MAG: Mrp/NBP35 family ATP-binding protein [Clostridia bacterium]|nr:Mrp/NBP35 family ATP-binding protein [Clostridia bacterium]
MGCSHNCSSCSENCASRESGENKSMLAPTNSVSEIKHVIGIVSGKGGVGKSIVTSMLSVLMNRRGYKTAILDADITGPSIPKAFGLKPGSVEGTDLGMIPVRTKTGIEVMSLNLLLDEESKPVVWRGPVIAGAVKQFWSEVVWNDVDYMFVDMPPGTGDVPLTVFQSLPLDGIIIVSSPQELVSMIVEKAINTAALMKIPVLGLVENMSYLECPDCGKKIEIFGKSHIDELAAAHGLEVLAKIPINPAFATQIDGGVVELFDHPHLDHAADLIEKKFPIA